MNAQRDDAPDLVDDVLVPVPIYDITPDEAWQIFDENARYYLGMSGTEFRRKWRAREFGDVDNHPDHVKLMDVAMLLPAVEGYEPEL